MCTKAQLWPHDVVYFRFRSSWIHVETVESDGALNDQSVSLTGDPQVIMLTDYTQSEDPLQHELVLSLL